ncbi:PREDICTED: agamous-like MADS-box protein AGL49 [Camelina sativa]|uniref:Agamous-like MADS-box protein AGL49 n=1 Tax=Camelina sativa TaxID=90675 RepID=A0ABM1QQW8_CAMSA|nr:PREDICTED: agamous-like MADS-box protein AGL49 [Camelina sativa]
MAPPRNFSDADVDLKTKKNFFKKKFPGFKKKATELSVLCGNSVGFICYGPNNDLQVWPEPQDNPQALSGIVGKFNAISDQKRKNHACDLYDFVSDIKGLSVEDLRRHIDKLSSQLVGIKQRKTSMLRRGDSKNSKPKETEEDDHIRVSENATITNCNVAMMMPEDRLGFDEFPGYHETDSSLGSYSAFTDVGVSDSSLFDPFTFGDYFPVPPTDNFGVDGVWDLCPMDLEFSSLFPGYDPLSTDSFMSSTYQTPVIEDNLASVF